MEIWTPDKAIRDAPGKRHYVRDQKGMVCRKCRGQMRLSGAVNDVDQYRCESCGHAHTIINMAGPSKAKPFGGFDR